MIELIPEADVLCALEPDELGLRMLPALATWPPQQHDPLTARSFVRRAAVIDSGPVLPSQYPIKDGERAAQAIREAWAWLEGAALLIEHPSWQSPNAIRMLSRRAQPGTAAEPDARKVFSARRLTPRWREQDSEPFSPAKFEAVSNAIPAYMGAWRVA